VLDPSAAAVAPLPPVAPVGASMNQDIDDLLAAPVIPSVPPPPAEPAMPPHPSPGDVPEPHPVAPPQPATPMRSPERAPAPRIAPERAPAPQRSPEPVRKLDAAARASALDRLRDRAKKLAEMPSYFPVGERSSSSAGGEVTKLEPGHTPVLGSFVAERDK
jgi:hypothetical protein